MFCARQCTAYLTFPKADSAGGLLLRFVLASQPRIVHDQNKISFKKLFLCTELQLMVVYE